MGELFDRVLAGDPVATNDLQNFLRQFARQICHGGGPPGATGIDWEDVAQECSRKLLSGGLERFRGDGDEKSYLYSMVKVTVLEMARTASRRRRREEAAAPADLAPTRNPDALLDVRSLLSALDEICQEVIQRVVLQEEPYADVARDLGLAESSVRSRLSRCIARARLLASGESPS